MLETTVKGLEALQRLTHTGGPAAAAVLLAIDAGLSAILEGLVGNLTPEDVAAQVKTLVDRISSNDAAADADLAKKFDTSGE